MKEPRITYYDRYSPNPALPPSYIGKCAQLWLKGNEGAYDYRGHIRECTSSFIVLEGWQGGGYIAPWDSIGQVEFYDYTGRVANEFLKGF